MNVQQGLLNIFKSTPGRYNLEIQLYDHTNNDFTKAKKKKK